MKLTPTSTAHAEVQIIAGALMYLIKNPTPGIPTPTPPPYPQPNYLEGLLSVGGKYLDGVSFHHYQYGTDMKIDRLAQAYAMVLEALDKYGRSDVPVFISEGALICPIQQVPCLTPPSFRTSLQPTYFVKWNRFVEKNYPRCAMFIWYTGEDAQIKDSSLLHTGGTPKPVNTTFATAKQNWWHYLPGVIRETPLP